MCSIADHMNSGAAIRESPFHNAYEAAAYVVAKEIFLTAFFQGIQIEISVCNDAEDLGMAYYYWKME